MRAQDDCRRNVRLLEAFTIFINMGFFIPVLVPYYKDEMGLDFNDFLIGEACFAATVVLLEVPTGWISDVWKRTHTLALGAAFELLGYACLAVGDNLAWAIAGQSIVGIGISLMSGTNMALLYDSLLSAGRESEYRRREGKRGALMFYSVAGASVVGGLVYPLNHMAPVLMSLAAMSVALACALMMREPERHRKAPEKHPVADMVATAHYALRGHAEVGMIILFAAVMFCSTKLIMWTQQPYYMAAGVHESLFGILMAAGFLMAGASSHLGHRLDGKIGSIKALAGVWIVAAAVCVMAGLHVGWTGIGLLMIGGSCLYGLASPRVNEAINSRVTSERRATILSTQSLLVNLFFIPTSLAMGWIADHHGIGMALWGIAGWLSLAGLALLSVVMRKGARRMFMI